MRCCHMASVQDRSGKASTLAFAKLLACFKNTFHENVFVDQATSAACSSKSGAS